MNLKMKFGRHTEDTWNHWTITIVPHSRHSSSTRLNRFESGKVYLFLQMSELEKSFVSLIELHSMFTFFVPYDVAELTINVVLTQDTHKRSIIQIYWVGSRLKSSKRWQEHEILSSIHRAKTESEGNSNNKTLVNYSNSNFWNHFDVGFTFSSPFTLCCAHANYFVSFSHHTATTTLDNHLQSKWRKNGEKNAENK